MSDIKRIIVVGADAHLIPESLLAQMRAMYGVEVEVTDAEGAKKYIDPTEVRLVSLEVSPGMVKRRFDNVLEALVIDLERYTAKLPNPATGEPYERPLPYYRDMRGPRSKKRRW
jgi:hypothetical protein